MFYSKLKRQKSYEKKKDGSYYAYSHYKDAIIQDCLESCVYCDVHYREHAFEGMQLDHFRPQDYFKEHINNPENLVLSCPKCNRLKSNHWPGDKKDFNKPSHDGVIGFIDPFVEDIQEYYCVDSKGFLQALKEPAPYVIEILDLNRPSRIKVRQLRIIRSLLSKALKDIDNRVGLAYEDFCNGMIDRDKLKQKLHSYSLLRDDLHALI